ncbi:MULTISPECIES: CD1375 family protein [unclassified Enterococcus]|nr:MULTISPECIES: CD1375 family protein [unclassified Enterococcus]MDO0920148.1 CD1375 family protein [Enterococcus sp. B1E2]WIV14611.1 CD1375 family protein [Enterococcus sp. FZMF]
MNYSALEMLYATHIIEDKRTIESVPSSIREDVAEIVANAKKQEGTKE